MFRNLFSLGMVLSLAACGSRSREEAESAFQPEAALVEMVHGKVEAKESELAHSVVAVVSDGTALCTGTILDDQTILTAGHCLEGGPKNVAIVFALKVRGTPDSMMRKADRAIVNPAWKRTNEEGDIALLHFKGGLPTGYGPVKLSSAAVQRGTAVRMIGYGVSNPERNSGAGIFRETSSTVTDVTKGMLVIDEKKSGACFGDSGGPAFAQDGSDWIQIGVTHSGLNGECNEASEYTGLAGYIGWIHTAMSKLAR